MNDIGSYVYEGFEPLPYEMMGWGGMDPIFEELILKVRPKVIVELGSWKGESTLTMGKALWNHGLRDSKVYAIDTWLGSIEFWTTYNTTSERDLKLKNGYPTAYYQFISNVTYANLQETIIPVPNTTRIGMQILQAKNIIPELVYIDASHETDDVLGDIRTAYLWVNKGIVFGHDYNWETVRKAVDLFATEQNLEVKSVREFWIIEKLT